MLSLLEPVLEFRPGSRDSAECKPTNNTDNANDLKILSECISLPEKCESALTSSNISQVLWGMNELSKVFKPSPRFNSLVYSVSMRLSGDSLSLAIGAVLCLKKLVLTNGKALATSLLAPVLRSILQNPVKEFVELYEMLVDHIPKQLITEIVKEVIFELLKQDEAHQHAACNMLLHTPLEYTGLTPEVFSFFLLSPVLVSHYLQELVSSALTILGASWFYGTLVKQLLSIANSKAVARRSCVKTVIHAADNIDQKNIFAFITSAFNWSQSSDNIAIELLNKSDFLLQSTSADFSGKLREAAVRISTGPTSYLKMQLIDVLLSNSLLFANNENLLLLIVKNLAETHDLDVKLYFFHHLAGLYDSTKALSVRDHLFSVFVSAFSDQAAKVRNTILTSRMYERIGNQRLIRVIPLFLKCVSTCQSWRVISSSMSIFNRLPDEVIRQFTLTAVSSFNTTLTRFPSPLESSILQFYVRVLTISDTHDIMDQVTSHILKHFASSTDYKLRCVFLKIAHSCCFIIPDEAVRARLWPLVVTMADDPVSSVRSKAISTLQKFALYFNQIGDPQSEQEATQVFQCLEKDSDPYVQFVWSEVSPQMNKAKSQMEVNSLARRTLPYLSPSSNRRSSCNLIKKKTQQLPPSTHATAFPNRKTRRRSTTVSGEHAQPMLPSLSLYSK